MGSKTHKISSQDDLPDDFIIDGRIGRSVKPLNNTQKTFAFTLKAMKSGEHCCYHKTILNKIAGLPKSKHTDDLESLKLKLTAQIKRIRENFDALGKLENKKFSLRIHKNQIYVLCK